MEDHRLKAFCLVVEMGSFSKAAEAKFMTQSAMSHLIRNLEKELGARLLVRQAKRVVPTPAGRLLHERAQKILAAYRDIASDVSRLLNKPRGPLHLGASVTAAQYLLPQAFYDFSRAHDEVRIELAVGASDYLAAGLAKGAFELVIAEGNFNGGGFRMEPVADDEVVIIASENNPLARRGRLTVPDLLSQPFILPETGSGTRELMEDFLATARVDPAAVKIAMTLGNPELLLRMVQAGLGISFVSKWSVFRALQEGTVRILDVSGPRILRKFHLISPPSGLQTFTARCFADFLPSYRFFAPF